MHAIDKVRTITYLLRTSLGAVPKDGSFSLQICSWFLEEVGTQNPAVYSSNLMRLNHPALPQYGATWAHGLKRQLSSVKLEEQFSR